ncbi:MAG: polysaccharide biosynthesis protein [Oscillospiraceae bacterium]|nr:polysaccharide biosynthesis protein [Oscillospiraceae bacterium]
MKKQSFLQGAAILTATVALVKILGAVYKIPLGNMLGDEGFAHFSVAYSIYSLLLTISTAGLPVALSRLVARADALGDKPLVRRTFNSARAAFLVLGGVSTAVMLIFAPQLANLMEDPEARYAIFALAPSIVMVCLMSAYRGYSQGISNMTPTSVSQIIETVGKLLFGLALAWFLISRGYGLPLASGGAIAGVTLGAAFALIFIVLKVKLPRKSTVQITSNTVEHRKSQLIELFKIGIPITIGASVLSILALADAKLILGRLQDAGGYSYAQAKTLYGVFSKVQTLFNIPSSFIVPLTVSVIPAIAARLANNNRDGAASVTGTALKITTLLALPAGVGLSVLATPIVNVIYPGSHSEGAGLLAILGVASFFTCVTLVTNAILQAYGKERVPVYTMICGGILKISSTYFLTPILGIRGAAIGTIASFALISILNICVLVFKTGYKLNGSAVKLLFSSAVMGAAAWFVYYAVIRTVNRQLIALGAAIIVAVVIYAVLVVMLKVITKDDLAFAPKGDKIAKLLRLRYLFRKNGQKKWL